MPIKSMSNASLVMRAGKEEVEAAAVVFGLVVLLKGFMALCHLNLTTSAQTTNKRYSDTPSTNSEFDFLRVGIEMGLVSR